MIEAYGPEDVRREIAARRHLATLAFSEAGSRSRSWTRLGTAAEADGSVRLDARKSWVTAAGEADSYVWSSRPLAAAGPMTLWLVPSATPGLRVAGGRRAGPAGQRLPGGDRRQRRGTGDRAGIPAVTTATARVDLAGVGFETGSHLLFRHVLAGLARRPAGRVRP